jgi:ABC-type lipoprotein release transport system permease subunit
VFLEVVLLRANPNRSIYYFIGVSRVEEQTIELTSDVASYSSIPSGGELSSREQSRSFGIIIGDRITREVGVGI